MKSNYTYLAFQKDINTLLKKIEVSKRKFDYILALSRGGLVPGVVLSHKLKIPLIPQMWSTRDYKSLNVHTTWIPDQIKEGKKFLVVDDIYDSGETILSLFSNWSSFVERGLGINKVIDHTAVAVLLYNSDTQYPVEFFGTAFSRRKFKKFINFFWEI